MSADEPVFAPATAAASLAKGSLEEAIQSSFPEVVAAAAADPRLTEDLALALLKRPDLPPQAVESIHAHGGVARNRKVLLALVSHPRAPRHVSLALLRQLYVFELRQLALMPIAPADVKRAADDLLVGRLETISLGERLSLARRSSTAVAGALLADKDTKVMQAALDNSRLTEAAVVRSLMKKGTASLVAAVCRHPKWPARREVRVALLQNEHTPLASALEFARSLRPPVLREILQHSRLPAGTKCYLLKETQAG